MLAYFVVFSVKSGFFLQWIQFQGNFFLFEWQKNLTALHTKKLNKKTRKSTHLEQDKSLTFVKAPYAGALSTALYLKRGLQDLGGGFTRWRACLASMSTWDWIPGLIQNVCKCCLKKYNYCFVWFILEVISSIFILFNFCLREGVCSTG